MGETGPASPGATRPVFRVYSITEELRDAIRARRAALGLSVGGFVADAVAHELGPLVEALDRLGLLGRTGAGRRPARLPLSAPLLDELRRAGERVGLPAGRLLLLCLARAAGRKRRRPGTGAAAGGRGGAARAARRRGEDSGRRVAAGPGATEKGRPGTAGDPAPGASSGAAGDDDREGHRGRMTSEPSRIPVYLHSGPEVSEPGMTNEPASG